jgi:methylamine dehydrogenase accessory protein MauD
MISEWSIWNALGPASHMLLWAAVLFLGFLLLGTLRSLGLLRWHLEQLEATTPSRLGRNGLKPGKKAPDFTLPSVAGPDVSLHDFAGREVFLVFTQAGCGPCHNIIPELNRLAGRVGYPSHTNRELQVLVVNKGDVEAARDLAAKTEVRFPVLVQIGLDLWRKYEAFATPFAFLIDEQGIVASKGIITNKQHIGYVLAGAGAAQHDAVSQEPWGTDNSAFGESYSPSSPQKELQHV